MLGDLDALVGAGAVAARVWSMVDFMLMAMVTIKETTITPRLAQSVVMVTFFFRSA